MYKDVTSPKVSVAYCSFFSNVQVFQPPNAGDNGQDRTRMVSVLWFGCKFLTGLGGASWPRRLSPSLQRRDLLAAAVMQNTNTSLSVFDTKAKSMASEEVYLMKPAPNRTL